MALIQRLQNSPLTRWWLFKYWQHRVTGVIIITWFWEFPDPVFKEYTKDRWG